MIAPCCKAMSRCRKRSDFANQRLTNKQASLISSAVIGRNDPLSFWFCLNQLFGIVWQGKNSEFIAQPVEQLTFNQ
jgi:hypothetical protein